MNVAQTAFEQMHLIPYVAAESVLMPDKYAAVQHISLQLDPLTEILDLTRLCLAILLIYYVRISLPGITLQGIKWKGRGADHSLHTDSRLALSVVIPPLPHTSS